MKLKSTSIVFLILLLLTSVLTFSAFFDETEVSSKENRTLQEFPVFNRDNYLSGKFFKDMESFFYDHFPYKETILNASKIYDKVKGIEPEIMAIGNTKNVSLVNEVNKKDNKNKKSQNPQTNKERAKEHTKNIAEDMSVYKTQTQNISVLATKDRIMELYHFKEDSIAYYAATLNEFAKKLPDDIKLYSLLAPTQVAMNGEEYRDYSDPQDKGIEYIYSKLDKRYEPVYVFNHLYENRDSYLYFRSDHHWTQLGAYYAAEEFAKSAKVDFISLDKYRKSVLEGFLGSLYNNNPLEKIAENPDAIETYYYYNETPVVEATHYNSETGLPESHIRLLLNEDIPSYNTFLGGDSPIIKIQNPKPSNKRNLLIVKDSYANAFIPWLVPSFNKIIVIDPRYFGDNIYTLAEEEGISDFLVLDYVLATSLDIFIDNIAEVSAAEAKE